MNRPDKEMSKYPAVAIIVLFCPGDSQIRYFYSILSKHIKLYLLDNTPAKKRRLLRTTGRIKVICNHKNRGIAYALNQGITEAVKDGHRLYFLFDQDTVVDESYLEAMICKYKSDTNTANTGYIVPNFFDRYSRTFAKFPILSKFQFYHADCANTAYRLEFNSGAVIAITSGMLIDYEKYKLIGDFKEEYFIDFIDNEYALRASTKGLKIRVCCNAIIDHSIGKRQIKNFLGLTVKPNHHHPVRRYFISRNGIRVAIEYKSIYPVFFALLILRMLHEILSIILFENSKSKKLQMIFKGLNNGLRGNMDHQIMIDRLNNSS